MLAFLRLRKFHCIFYIVRWRYNRNSKHLEQSTWIKPQHLNPLLFKQRNLCNWESKSDGTRGMGTNMIMYLSSQGIHAREKSSSVLFSHEAFYSSGSISFSFVYHKYPALHTNSRKKQILKKVLWKKQLSKYQSLQLRVIQVRLETS